MKTLVRRLQRDYPPTHKVTLYRAPSFPGKPPLIKRLHLSKLPEARIQPLMTLYIPPMPPREPDRRVLAWLEE
jgi:hypothetical protein